MHYPSSTHLLTTLFPLLTTPITAHLRPQPTSLSPSLAPRDNTGGLLITYFLQENCQGPSTPQDINLDASYTDIGISSYYVSRDLGGHEQLDFSTHYSGYNTSEGVDASCALFLETTNPDTNGNTLRKGICYGLLGGETANVSDPFPGST